MAATQKFLFHILLIPCCLVLTASPADAQPGGKKWKHHTSIRLIADVQSVQPGSTFLVGLLMKMDPGWHTYWKNSGEAGLPPEIKWTLPQGVDAGEIRWPVPHKYNEGGEVITYGYEDENMLIVPMTASVLLKPGTRLTLRADVSWLECERVCIPASGSDQISLPVAERASEKVNVALFRRYGELVPGRFSPDESFSLSTAARSRVVELRLVPLKETKIVVVEGDVPDFYPEAFEELEIGRTIVAAASEGVTLRVPISVFEKGVGPQAFRGLLVYQLPSGERKAAVVEVPLSDEFLSTLPVVGGSSGGLLDKEFFGGEGLASQDPLFLYVFFAIVGGLLLNIMPCVLPVIGLKVFGLVKMGGEDHGRVRRVGVFFSLGILASFVALALLVIVLKSVGEQVGWGFQFQEPLFVIVMSVIVFAFALSLFGVYEIRLPSGIGRVAAQSTGNRNAGSFWEGVFATILATPCTAPILGTALGFAFAQPAGVVLLIFSCVAIGMALPYFLLTLNPAWMRWLPKPGDWMVTAKQFMGFLMMATLVWLLYILGRQLGMEAIVWVSAFLLFVAVACWLFGRFATLTASRPRYYGTLVLALVILLAGSWLFLEPVLAARSVLEGDATNTSGSDVETEGILWEQFSLQALEGHLSAGKAVFIDFTADWCVTCKVNEKVVLSSESVVEKFRTSGIIAIKADWTSRNTDITRLLAKFGRSGVPLYVLFPRGRPTEPIVLPEVITGGMVVEAIEKAR